MIYSDGQLIMRHHSIGSLSWNTVERWEGGAVTTLSRRLLLQSADCITINEEENVIKAGPYKLEVLEWHYDIDRILAVRQAGLRTKVFVVGYKVKKLWLEVYHRLILTAWIWELANRTPGEVPTWQDLKIIKWLRHND